MKSNAAPRRPANAARTWPLPLTSLALAVSRASVMPPASMPARVDHAVDRGPLVGEDDRAVEPPAAHREGAGKAAPLAVRCASIRWAPPTGAKASVPPSAAAGERQPAGEAAGIGAQIAARSACRRHRARRWRSIARPPFGQQDPAVAGERPEPRAAAGAIIEAGRGRHRAAGACRARPSASLGRSSSRSSARPLDPAVEDQLAAGRISPAARVATMWKVPSRLRWPAPRQPQLGRVELQVGEVDDAVVAALEVGLEPRQAAGRGRGRSCCRAAAPRPWRCRRRASPCRSGPGTTLRSVMTSTMPRPGIR